MSSLDQQFLGYNLPGLIDIDATKVPEVHLTKDYAGNYQVTPGRRTSDLLCVNALRKAVGEWRNGDYEGASQTTKQLFHWWFDTEREVMRFGLYKPYFVQREVIETLVYLLEIKQIKDVSQLIQEFGYIGGVIEAKHKPRITHTMDNVPQLQIPTLDKPIELPQENLARFAVKAATGSGKTMVMAYIIAWSALHRKREKGSKQADNFLIVTPNVIVFDRISRDFADASIFRDLDIFPPGMEINFQVIQRGDGAEPVGKNTLVVTNIQQLFENKVAKKSDNPIAQMLGIAPVKGAKQERPLFERVKGLSNLMVLNDEAHHLWDDDLAWNQTILKLAKETKGFGSWLDFTATPKDQGGIVFPWVVTDYPLAQAVEHQIVKFPIVAKVNASTDLTKVTEANAVEKYMSWIRAGVDRLKAHEKAYGQVKGAKPVMFIMCENTKSADAVGLALIDPKMKFGFNEDEVLVIHTNAKGEVKDADIEKLREMANSVDDASSKVRVVVSVLMLREGWDVKNISIVLGLRPGNARANILPEQTVGRGLRLMANVAGRQVLEVLGTPAFEEIVRGLEAEGVFVGATDEKVPSGNTISPVKEKKKYDIAIPSTSAIYNRAYQNLNDFKASDIEPTFLFDPNDKEISNTGVTFEAFLERVHIGEGEISGSVLQSNVSISMIVQNAIRDAQVTQDFAGIFPVVREYVRDYCFGVSIDLDSENVRKFLTSIENRLKIVRNVAVALGNLVLEQKPIEIVAEPLRLSEIESFRWMRGITECEKTVFNYVTVMNNYEAEFAQALDSFSDVKAFSALAETFTQFFVNYPKPNGAIGRYYPDWVVKYDGPQGIEFWIIETKGREFPGVEEKDKSMALWCEKVSKQESTQWNYTRVNQDWWKTAEIKSFTQLLADNPFKLEK